MALRRCETWQCPHQGYAPAATREALPEAERTALETIQRVTGYAPTTCPYAALRSSARAHSDVPRACRAKRYSLVATVEPDPPAWLIEAVDAIEHGESEHLAWIREHPAAPPAHTQPFQGPIESIDALPRRGGR